MPDLTITVPGEAISAYFAIGVVLWLPLEWKAWRSTTRRAYPFWSELRRGLKQRPWGPFVAIVVWPLAVREMWR